MASSEEASENTILSNSVGASPLKTAIFSFAHRSNASQSIVVTLFEIVTLVSLLQPERAEFYDSNAVGYSDTRQIAAVLISIRAVET